MLRKSFLTTRLLVIVFIIPDYPYPLTRRPCGEEISFNHEASRDDIHFLSPPPTPWRGGLTVRISLFTTRLLVIVYSNLHPYPLTRRPHCKKISIHHEVPLHSVFYQKFPCDNIHFSSPPHSLTRRPHSEKPFLATRLLVKVFSDPTPTLCLFLIHFSCVITPHSPIKKSTTI